MRKASTPIAKPKRKVKYIPKKPTKYNEEQIVEALQKAGGAIYATADNLDINVQTLYGYFRRWPHLKKVVKYAKKLTIDKVVHKLVEQALAGEIRAIKYYLSSQAKHLGYGNTKEVKVEHSNVPPAPSTVPELSDEVKRRLLDKARAYCGLTPLSQETPLQIGVQELPEYPPRKPVKAVVVDHQPTPDEKTLPNPPA